MKKEKLKKEIAAEEAAMADSRQPADDTEDEVLFVVKKDKDAPGAEILIQSSSPAALVTGVITLLKRTAELLDTSVTSLLSLITVTYISATSDGHREQDERYE